MVTFATGDKVRTEEGLVGVIVGQTDEMAEDGQWYLRVSVPDGYSDVEMAVHPSTLEHAEQDGGGWRWIR